MINVLLAVQLNQVEQFLDNWRIDVTETPQGGLVETRRATDFVAGTPGIKFIDVYDPEYCIVNQSEQGLWKNIDSGAPPQQKQLVTMMVADITELDWTDPQDPSPGTVLTIVHYIREAFPGAVQVLDCFTADGVRHGQSLVPELDVDGNVIGETIVGQPTYPPLTKTEFLQYVPDDVTYDQNGNEISRLPATNYKQVILPAGYSSRRYE